MNTLDSLFEWVLAATLRASALAAVVFGIQFVLRRRLPATWRHALWLPVLLVLILPVLPQVPFGIFPRQEVPAPIAMETNTAISALPVAEKTAIAPTAPRASLTPMGFAAIAWLAGACVMLGAGVAGYRLHLNRIKKAASLPDEELARTLRETTREAGLGKMPRVLMSPAVESPAVTGLIRPLLLLPATFPRGFSDAEARLILLHELTHVKRGDLPLNWLACVLQSMHWFNPLLWFAFARMREDREAACDAQVLSLGTDRRSEYGNALLKLQLSGTSSKLSLGFVGIFERSANLRSRIQDISTHRRAHPAWRPAGVALVGILTLAGATEAQERQPRRETDAPQNVEAKDPRQVALEKKLDAIVIPVVGFEDTSLEEAIDFLRQRSRELDTTTEVAADKGVNFVIRKGPKDQPKGLTMELRNVTLRKAIENVAEAAGLTMTVSRFAVTLMPSEDAEQFEARSKLARSKAMKAAAEIILPMVDFEDASLEEAVDFLNLRAAELAKDGKAPKIEAGKLEKGEARVKELRLRNVPLSEALTYVAEQVKAPLFATDEVIRIGK